MIELLLYPAVFGAGIGTGYLAGVRAGGGTLNDVTTPPRPNRRFVAGIVVLVMLVLAGVFTAKEVTDRAADQRVRAFQTQAECINQWGEDVVETIQTRNEATLMLEKAEARKDRAFDEVIRVSTLLSRIPPEAVQADLSVALEESNQARLNVIEVRAEVNETKALNTYPASPKLTCAID